VAVSCEHGNEALCSVKGEAAEENIGSNRGETTG
jgi:hypothetical protein